MIMLIMLIDKFYIYKLRHITYNNYTDTAVSTALKGKNMNETDMGEGTETGHAVAKADFE